MDKEMGLGKLDNCLKTPCPGTDTVKTPDLGLSDSKAQVPRIVSSSVS